MPNEHSEISPSMLHRIMGDSPCHASVRMGRNIAEPPSSEAAALGTALHEIAEKHLMDETDSGDPTIQKYLDYVRATAGLYEISVEEKLGLNAWVPDMFGTADAVIDDEDRKILHVIDLKTGQHPVKPKDNFQLMAYALGVIGPQNDKHAFNMWDGYQVALHIAQPPIDNFTKWTVPIEEIWAFGEDLRAAGKAALSPDSEFNSTESNCRWCKAAGVCPELHKKTVEVMGKRFDPLPPTQLSDEELALILTNKKDIEFYLRAAYKHALERWVGGKPIRGFKLVEGTKKRVWGENAKDALVKELGAFAFQSEKLITITEATKSIGAKAVAELCVTPKGDPSLVATDDPRPALSGEAIKKLGGK